MRWHPAASRVSCGCPSSLHRLPCLSPASIAVVDGERARASSSTSHVVLGSPSPLRVLIHEIGVIVIVPTF